MELMMTERDLTVSFETVRRWCDKVGRAYSTRLRRCRGPVGDTWHLDEEYLKTNGQFQYLWRAVGQEGQVIDILVQNRRDFIVAERSLQRHVLIPPPPLLALVPYTTVSTWRFLSVALRPRFHRRDRRLPARDR